MNLFCMEESGCIQMGLFIYIFFVDIRKQIGFYYADFL